MKRYIKAADGLILNENDNQIIASQIALNCEAEWDAIEGYQKLIPFLVRLSTREIFFITFYFNKIPITIWGNYNMEFPCFFENEKDMNFYKNLWSNFNE